MTRYSLMPEAYLIQCQSLAFRPGILQPPRGHRHTGSELLREQRHAKLLQHPAEFILAGRLEAALCLDPLAVTALDRGDLGGELRVPARIAGQLVEPLFDGL